MSDNKSTNITDLLQSSGEGNDDNQMIEDILKELLFKILH